MGGRKFHQILLPKNDIITHRFKKEPVQKLELSGCNPEIQSKELSQGMDKKSPSRLTERWTWLVQKASAGGLQQRMKQTQLLKTTLQSEVETRQCRGLVMELGWGWLPLH